MVVIYTKCLCGKRGIVSGNSVHFSGHQGSDCRLALPFPFVRDSNKNETVPITKSGFSFLRAPSRVTSIFLNQIVHRRCHFVFLYSDATWLLYQMSPFQSFRISHCDFNIFCSDQRFWVQFSFSTNCRSNNQRH